VFLTVVSAEDVLDADDVQTSLSMGASGIALLMLQCYVTLHNGLCNKVPVKVTAGGFGGHLYLTRAAAAAAPMLVADVPTALVHTVT